MSVVLGGYGLGCVVTRGYGCPKIRVPVTPQETCELTSIIDASIFLISPVMRSAMVMSFIDQAVEMASMVSQSCNMQSIIIQVVDLISSLNPPVEVELNSQIVLIVDLASPISCDC
jgi:hypothetical protein